MYILILQDIWRVRIDVMSILTLQMYNPLVNDPGMFDINTEVSGHGPMGCKRDRVQGKGRTFERM